MGARRSQLTVDGATARIMGICGKEEYMERLWAPWRMKYIKQAQRPAIDCFLCKLSKENNDEANLILFRGKLNFVILNSYPYNPGHMMVVPYRQVADLQDLNDVELKEHFEIVRHCAGVLKETFNTEGFNIGINIGRAAGAGVVDHIHTHIVPRWLGDSNFMPVIGGTKVISEALTETYGKLKPNF
jgi:ATP adenylyltransferase